MSEFRVTCAERDREEFPNSSPETTHAPFPELTTVSSILRAVAHEMEMQRSRPRPSMPSYGPEKVDK